MWSRLSERSEAFPRAPSPPKELMAFSDRQRCSTTGSFGSWRRPTRWFCCRFSILHLPREQELELYWSHHHHACQIITDLLLLAGKSVLICAVLLPFFDKHITISVIIHHSWNFTCPGGNDTCCYSLDQTTEETATKTTLIRTGEQTLSGSSVESFVFDQEMEAGGQTAF